MTDLDLSKLRELAVEARTAHQDYIKTLPHNEQKAQRLSAARARLCSFIEPFDLLCDLVDELQASRNPLKSSDSEEK